VAVASAGPYASLHLAPDNHASTPPLSFFTGRTPFLPPNQQHQCTEGKDTYGTIQVCLLLLLLLLNNAHRKTARLTAACDLVWSMTSSSGYAELNSSMLTACSNPNLKSSVCKKKH